MIKQKSIAIPVVGHTLLVAALILICIGIVHGCVTVKPDAYRVGRLTTVAYLLEKDRLSDKQNRAIKKVYLVFDLLADSLTVEGADRFDKEVKNMLHQNISDDAEYLIAAELVDAYWKEFLNKVYSSDYTDAQLVRAIKDFHRGTKDVLSEYL